MSQEYLVATVFILYAVVAIIRPDVIARFQSWVNKTILGAEFKASQRTLQYYRAMGLIFAGLSILIMFDIIN